ncbi:Hypothetical_protein [Hexamita inflata]|uniref:Hypothetical_protein n=1 Tax=Hexamita inflata TaxID=28002 RepID=A0AA86RRT4_9EUKA|nr:Hypothetical protein HINF_LOCUS66113 [Hexamita inflata]
MLQSYKLQKIHPTIHLKQDSLNKNIYTLKKKELKTNATDSNSKETSQYASQIFTGNNSNNEKKKTKSQNKPHKSLKEHSTPYNSRKTPRKSEKWQQVTSIYQQCIIRSILYVQYLKLDHSILVIIFYKQTSNTLKLCGMIYIKLE